MDTILILLLLYGLFKKLNKGAAAKKGRTLKKNKETLERVLQSMQTYKEPKRQETQKQPIRVNEVKPEPIGEGQSYMAFTQDEHGCVSEQEEYMGSLHADTSEGEDACDLSLGHERTENIEPQSVYAEQIGMESPFDFSPKALYQGVVMSEILTRPSERRRSRF